MDPSTGQDGRGPGSSCTDSVGTSLGATDAGIEEDAERVAEDAGGEP